MTGSPASDPILKRFRAAVQERYGDRIERVVLSARARGAMRGRIRITTLRCFFVTQPASGSRWGRCRRLRRIFCTTRARLSRPSHSQPKVTARRRRSWEKFGVTASICDARGTP
jgi:hypothetical protein